MVLLSEGKKLIGNMQRRGQPQNKEGVLSQEEGNTEIKRKEKYSHNEKLDTDGHVCTRHITGLCQGIRMKILHSDYLSLK